MTPGLFCIYQEDLRVSFSSVRDWSLIREKRVIKREGERACKVLPLRKVCVWGGGGAEKVLAMLRGGGAEKVLGFGVVFTL